MITKIVKIGNSHGVRLPKSLLKDLGTDKVDIKIEKNVIVLTPVYDDPLKGWAESFKRMSAAGDDNILLDFPNNFDAE